MKKKVTALHQPVRKQGGAAGEAEGNAPAWSCEALTEGWLQKKPPATKPGARRVPGKQGSG